jgi:hypothetical protein
LGQDTWVRQTFSGWRVQVRLHWPGVRTRVCLAPAKVSERAALPAWAEGTGGLLLGDRKSWSPKTAAEWRARGVALLAPSRRATRDPHPRWSALLRRVRYRLDTVFIDTVFIDTVFIDTVFIDTVFIDTAFGQLSARWTLKRVWARDRWPLSSRPASGTS